MNKNILPIGTVVMLTGGTKKVMITGYSSEDYDYNGCIFPEGYMENIFVLFNNNQIEEVFYKGLENEESTNYINRVESLLKDKTGINGLTAQERVYQKEEKTHIRVPQEPTNPISKSEMLARSEERISAGQTKKFDFSKLDK